MNSEYPIVDGNLSVACYLDALDKCYRLYKKKYKNLHHKVEKETIQTSNIDTNSHLKNDLNNNEDNEMFNLDSAEAFIFHSPYSKMVQKSFARLLWNDYLDSNLPKSDTIELVNLEKFKLLDNKNTLINKDLEKELIKLSNPLFKKKTEASLLFSKRIGNMYTPSLYSCLASFLLSLPIQQLYNKRICLFSYGSGLASSMYSLKIGDAESESNQFKLQKIIDTLTKQHERLENDRFESEPKDYDACLTERAISNKKVPRTSEANTGNLFPGTWYLKSVDDKYRREYERKQK
jgi:hydroxymethylglutaryl-CoA synthase